MNREETKKRIEVMQAFLDGKTVQYASVTDGMVTGAWVDDDSPSWDAWDDRDNLTYRIKPEPREFWVSLDGRSITRHLCDTPFDNSEWIRVREVLDE